MKEFISQLGYIFKGLFDGIGTTLATLAMTAALTGAYLLGVKFPEPGVHLLEMLQPKVEEVMKSSQTSYDYEPPPFIKAGSTHAKRVM